MHGHASRRGGMAALTGQFRERAAWVQHRTENSGRSARDAAEPPARGEGPRSEPRPGGGPRIAGNAASPQQARPTQEARERTRRKGADTGLVTSGTPLPAEYAPAGKPDGYRWMEHKACFRNAFTLATGSHSLLYGEGFALRPLGSGGPHVWVHHAWVIDPDGRAIDVTWRDRGLRYIGIAVRPGELLERQLRKARHHLVEPVLATMVPVAGDLAEVSWDLADWFTGGPDQAREAGH